MKSVKLYNIVKNEGGVNFLILGVISIISKNYFKGYIIPITELPVLQKSCCVLISFLFQSVKTEKEYKKDCFSKKPLRISLVDIFI